MPGIFWRNAMNLHYTITESHIERMKEYIAKHSIDDMTEWKLDGSTEREKLETLYRSLLDEAEEIDPGEYGIEISSHSTKSGASVLFTFDGPENWHNRTQYGNVILRPVGKSNG